LTPSRSGHLPIDGLILYNIFWQSAVLVPMVSAFLDDVTPTTPDLF